MQYEKRVQQLEKLRDTKRQQVKVLYFDEVENEEVQAYQDDGCFVIVVEFI